MNPNLELAETLNRLALHLCEVLDHTVGDIFCWVETDGKRFEIGIFQDEGSNVAFHLPDPTMLEEIVSAWEVAGDHEKWSTLGFRIQNLKFNAKFTFPDQLDAMATSADRRSQQLLAWFGAKPVLYRDLGPGIIEAVRGESTDDDGGETMTLTWLGAT